MYIILFLLSRFYLVISYLLFYSIHYNIHIMSNLILLTLMCFVDLSVFFGW